MNAATPSSPLSILLVDDNPGDIDLIRAALRRSCLVTRIQIARDGVEAMAELNRSRANADESFLDIVLLDLNLPRMNGHEVLRAIRRDPDARVGRVPVIVLTSSQAAEDVLLSYDLEADRYLMKPEGVNQFRELIQAIVDLCSEPRSMRGVGQANASTFGARTYVVGASATTNRG